MACRVITVSRALAAGGEEIARMVAGEVGFRYVDEEIVVRAAEQAGVSPETIERAEHTQPLIARILESMAGSSIESAAWSPHMMSPVYTSSTYQGLIERVIRETAEAGNVVIVAHGGSIPLAGTEGLLRVLVTASPEVRARRLAEQAKLDEGQAKKAIQDSDRQRREFLRRFYNVDQELPTHYDLVVNTDALTLPQAARVIVSAARG